MLRQFIDENGRRWRVWDVNPVLHGQSTDPGTPLPSGAPRGWLCFESESERRRLTPIPVGWMECDDAALQYLCGRAQPVQQAFTHRPPVKDA